ncbi:MAG: hydrolase Nlp/P60 [Crocinitomicaceae bacterium]|nr:hydrolase Nlp/P60 [Crocinitomicaceae bacterium]|tara:strand:+ start:6885 stop:7658 length:774 start_codon:yes stop_codon:yes gene_type:complete
MEYGISILGIVPLRAEAKDQSEIISQVLFGQHFKIIETQPKWIKIELASDKYVGWICAKQYVEITHEDYDNLSLNDFPLAEDVFSSLINIEANEYVPISMGAVLPFYHEGMVKIRNKKYKYNGTVSNKTNYNIIYYAKQFLNAPYLWGGKSILGIDCSGFTQLVCQMCGINLPRDAYQQALEGELIENIDDIIEGDLIFFINENLKIHHVGIAMDNKSIIHASGQVRIDELSKNGIIHSESKSLTHKLHSIKRVTYH